jgi:hypothetical protein
MARPGSEPAPWRRRLRRELAGLVALKVAALALLWWLFFSAAHHTRVDAAAAGRRLGMTPSPAQRTEESRVPERLRAGLRPATGTSP